MLLQKYVGVLAKYDHSLPSLIFRYVFDADVILPILIQRLEEYNFQKCANRMYGKCDLKTVLHKNPDLKHLQSFC